jgi:N-acetylmuramoyl-L-alanine amidase
MSWYFSFPKKSTFLRKFRANPVIRRGNVKNIVSVGILALVVVLSSFVRLDKRSFYTVRTVVIDAGHGGRDPGTHGKYVKEKDVALKVALQLGKIIKDNYPNVKVYYTRMSDKFMELHDRAGLANRNHADLFISIHCNANPSRNIFGTETYAMGLHTSEGNLDVAKRENSVIYLEDDHEENYGGFDPDSPMAHILMANYQSAYLDNSLRFAAKIEKQFQKHAGRKSRGVKQAGFVVLWKSAMPSVLVEIGFLSNPVEEKYLQGKTGQTQIATGIYRAFREYKEEMEAMND